MSSQIEGTQVTLDDILDPEVKENQNAEIADILNYLRAANFAMGRMKELPLCNRKYMNYLGGYSYMDFLQLAKSRCTTRGFTNQSISTNDLDYILSAGRVAPTACNQQPQRIIVVQQPENIMKVQKAYKTFGSQCILIVCRDRRNELIRPYDQKCSGDLDIGIVCDHMMLAARERNIGSVMVGLFDPEIIKKEFGIPECIEPTALLVIGYPGGEFLSPERHDTERKPLADIVMIEHYNECSLSD